jgi:Asp-tRNA(Asn)/Glu-tRNA(Gln) amidotransferase A subunit family amidase
MTLSPDDLAFMPATAMAAAIRSRKLSPVEVTRAILERIDRLNPRLNAYLTVDGEGAMQAARRAEQAVVSGADLGPLHGVPVSIKDLVCTRGLRTTFGSLLHQDNVPDHDAGAVERLRAAGAIILGKTNTPELGLMGTTENRLGQPCRNPWNQERTCGGSSGGAASAVAAGLGPLALGTDGGGSVRIPSGFCGVFGLKPTFGRVPHHSDFGGWGTLSVTGPIARTVADAALMLDVMAGAHPEDPYSLPAPQRPFRRAMKGDLHGLRAAWSADLGYGAVDPEVRRMAEAAAHRFADFGCIVEEDHPGIEDPLVSRVFIDLTATLTAGELEGVSPEQENLLTEYAIAFRDYGQRVTGLQVVQANRGRFVMWTRLRDFFHRYDLLLTPTLSVPAFPIGEEPRVIDGRPVLPFGWSPFTPPFNLSGQPAATVPCGWSADGLPVGLQIVGRPFEEATVLRAAAAFEAAQPWQQRRPPL